MSLSAREYLQHILDETRYIIEYSQGLEREDFVANETLKRAFLRSLEVIGEAVKNFPLEFREKYPTIQWRLIAGMRDRLIHNYFGVDYDIVWDTVTNKVPMLDREIRRIMIEEGY